MKILRRYYSTPQSHRQGGDVGYSMHANVMSRVSVFDIVSRYQTNQCILHTMSEYDVNISGDRTLT